MEVHFTNMRENQYQLWVEALIKDYAEDNIRSGNWEESEAYELSRNQTFDLLKDGINTKNHFLLAVYNSEEEHVGNVWLAKYGKSEPYHSAWIYEVEIKNAFRGKGYGTKTMKLIEEYLQKRDVTEIGLNVFGYNKTAINLYIKMGYEVTAQKMRKKL